jgi:excisionase family DNA binding protein
MERAFKAEELADLLQMSRITILRRAKRGTIPSFRVGTCVRFDSAAIKQMVDRAGRPIHVQALSTDITALAAIPSHQNRSNSAITIDWKTEAIWGSAHSSL